MTETDLNETDNLADSGTHYLIYSALDTCLRVPGSLLEGFKLNNDFWSMVL